jgi:hypothetical protein
LVVSGVRHLVAKSREKWSPFVIYVAVRCLFGFGAPDAVWRPPRRFARL